MPIYNSPCRYYTPVNSKNFLRWYPVYGTIAVPTLGNYISPWPIPICCDNSDAPIPYNSLLNADIWQAVWYPEYPGAVFNGYEDNSILSNYDTPQAFTNPNDSVLALINSQGRVRFESGSPPTYVEKDTGTYQWYMKQLSLSDTTSGVYYLVHLDKVDSRKLLYISCPIYVYATADIQKCYAETNRFEFRDPQNLYGFEYTADATLQNSYRLKVGQGEVQYEDETEVYREVTTGKHERYAQILSRKLTFKTEHADQFFHEALVVALQHETVKINGKIVELADPYEINTQMRRNRHTGTFSVYDVPFGSVNYGC